MNRLTQSYRVKVFVDGKWISTGDFRDLECAKDHARKLTLHLDRQVEIRDANGRLVATGAVTLTGDEDQTLVFDDETNTIVLD